MAEKVNGDLLKLADSLARCKKLPGSYDKRFARDVCAMLHEGRNLTVNQRRNLIRLVLRYRRQISSEIVALAKELQAADSDQV